jgi:hypothetical protein
VRYGRELEQRAYKARDVLALSRARLPYALHDSPTTLASGLSDLRPTPSGLSMGISTTFSVAVLIPAKQAASSPSSPGHHQRSRCAALLDGKTAQCRLERQMTHARHGAGKPRLPGMTPSLITSKARVLTRLDATPPALGKDEPALCARSARSPLPTAKCHSGTCRALN